MVCFLQRFENSKKKNVFWVDKNTFIRRERKCEREVEILNVLCSYVQKHIHKYISDDDISRLRKYKRFCVYMNFFFRNVKKIQSVKKNFEKKKFLAQNSIFNVDYENKRDFVFTQNFFFKFFFDQFKFFFADFTIPLDLSTDVKMLFNKSYREKKDVKLISKHFFCKVDNKGGKRQLHSFHFPPTPSPPH